jgi:hypothetical protein
MTIYEAKDESGRVVRFAHLPTVEMVQGVEPELQGDVDVSEVQLIEVSRVSLYGLEYPKV